MKARYGRDALKFINSVKLKDQPLRGIYAKAVQPGDIKRGDIIRKI